MGGGSSCSVVETELQSVKFFQDNAHCYIIESSMEKEKKETFMNLCTC